MPNEKMFSYFNNCSYGGSAEYMTIYELKRYDGFIRCTKCGKEGRGYTSANAVRNWNKTNPTQTSDKK